MNPKSSAFGPWTYFTYPHFNGFCRDSSKLVIGKRYENRNQLWLCSMDGEPLQKLVDCSPLSKKRLLWDIAWDANELVTSFDNQVQIYDLDTGENSPVWEWQPPAGARLQQSPSISVDGRRLTFTIENGDRDELWLIERGSRARPVMSVDRSWNIGHVHFCPADENWIGFCHEGHAQDIRDRVWAWHPEHAPNGICVFDQKSNREGVLLAVGHER